ncbi:MAG: DUF5679 domain-containing protein [Thermoleophilia bacterium]
MTKERVENCAILDAWELASAGYLGEGSRAGRTWSRGGRDIAALYWHVEDDCLRPDVLLNNGVITEHPWPLELTRTQTSFGSERVWFCCPMCGERVRKLYLPPRGFHFACRSCHSLSYASRQTRGWGDWSEMAFREKLAKYALLNKLSLPDETGLDRFLDDLNLGPDEETASGPRPRGRPKEKRPYHRSTPFLTGKRPSERHGLCMRCRDYRELAEPQAVTLANGRSARKGTCPTCGATMILIVKG